MKRIFFVFSVLAAALAIIGCGNGRRDPSGQAVLTQEFFSSPIAGEITVSAFDSMVYRSYLEEAARLFEALYPGTRVNIETFSEMPEVRTGGDDNFQVTQVQMQDNPQARLDYLSRVNTNLMSGTGADLYAMDILPLHKFAGSGMLENLEPYMITDPDFKIADYRQNILEAVHYRGGLWFFPLDYSFNYYAYDSTLVPAEVAANFGVDKAFSADDLFRIGMPLYDGTYRLFNTHDHARGRGGMFNILLNQNMASFVDLDAGRVNFLDNGFAGLLDSVRDFAEQGFIPRGVTGQQQAGQIRQLAMETPADRFFFKHNAGTNLLSVYTRQLGMIMRMGLSGSASAIEADDEIAGIEANANGSVPFTSNLGFAMNSQSGNKAAAWAFLRFLLSREMQLSTNFVSAGFPIHNEARQERPGVIFAGGSGVMNEQRRGAMSRYNAAVEALSDNINAFVVTDTVINDMIAAEVQFFFNGSRSGKDFKSSLSKIFT